MTLRKDGIDSMARVNAARNIFAAQQVNPHDIDGMARQITTALSMSLEERRQRWQSMVRKLKAASVQNWFSDFLHTLSDVQRAPVRAATAPIVLELARRHRSALTGHVRSSAIPAMS